MTDPLALEPDGDGWRLKLLGDWSLPAMPRIEARLKSLPATLAGNLLCDWSDARAPGISPAWALLRQLAEVVPPLSVTHTGNPPHFLDLLQKLHVERHAAYSRQVPPTLERLVGKLGRWSVLQGVHARGVIVFLGRIATVVGEAFRRPRAWRISSLARHIYETGITAIPIVALIAFLISVIVAYLGAQQLSRFGADIFVVDLVTIATLREMGVLLTSIIVAGRSGSAFAAEIGVMQLNEETDALRAMGMNPVELLVVPRVVALVIALPLLTVIADAMGLAGGGLLSLINLHIPLPQFMARLRESLSPTTFWSGLVKAPVFAVLIAMVGTYRGMQVRDSARELGRLTTVAVVQSIFMVILADALFAVLFVQIHF
ncbi:MAG TPA: ABC transporter permease [Steroidobacteraceae bacterium]|jgi:phospholipid/cholesterol/gamma-HCH transport system permease protein